MHVVDQPFRPVTFWDCAPGMIVLFDDADRTRIALVVRPRSENDYPDLLPLSPFEEDGQILDGRAQQASVFAQVDRATLDIARADTSAPRQGRRFAVPPGALVRIGDQNVVAGSSSSRRGFDVATGQAVQLTEPNFWFARWSIVVPRSEGVEPFRLCTCEALPATRTG